MIIFPAKSILFNNFSTNFDNSIAYTYYMSLLRFDVASQLAAMQVLTSVPYMSYGRSTPKGRSKGNK